eukprot:4370245-Lingulodinium_polyedra.AAC.1
MRRHVHFARMHVPPQRGFERIVAQRLENAAQRCVRTSAAAATACVRNAHAHTMRAPQCGARM